MTGPQSRKLTGACLCGAVRFELAGTPRPPIACHCSQCRRTSGHHAAFSAVPHADLSLTERRGLKWFRSSEIAERGFCGECGANLFWKRDGAGHVSVAAGSLDQPTGLALSGHIFAASKGDYYAIADGLPSYPEDDDGALAGDSGKRLA